jgi:S1-C subfamily serine protease
MKVLSRRRHEPDRKCPNCQSIVRPGAHFCGVCGKTLPEHIAARPTRRTGAWQIGLAVIGLLALGLAAFAAVDQHLALSKERSARQNQAADIKEQLARERRSTATLSAQNETLANRLRSLSKEFKAAQGGFEPLAQRILRSVFTVETATELGTAWAAWTQDGAKFLITANHVIAGATAAGETTVDVKQKNKSWTGTIEKTDSVNDLAVVRVPGKIAPLLWQRPQLGVLPLAGDQLLLLGSPYGLEGTVTTGVVSRVSYNAIQTDAAANPGNSGGPAVDRQGNVVGVLLSAGGQNLNFAVPIQRACVTIRTC